MLHSLAIVLTLFLSVPPSPELRSEERRERIEHLRGMDDEASLIELSRMVRLLGQDENDLDPQDTINLRDAKVAVMAITRYAERLAERVQQQTESEIAGDYNPLIGRVIYLEALAQIRQPESLRALGTLLFDERDPWKDIKGWGDGGRPLPNSYLSMISLAKMKIRNPPTDAYPRFPEDIIPWQTWFEEVRSGKRTFSFEGDPQVYTLAGPVAQPGLTKTTIAAPSPAAGAGKRNESSQWPLIVVLVIFGVGAVVLVLRTRKALRDS